MDTNSDSTPQSDTTPASTASLHCLRETSSPPHSPVLNDCPPLSPLYGSYSLYPLVPVAAGSTLLSSSATSSSTHPAAIGSSLHPPVTVDCAATGFSSFLPVKTGSSSCYPIAMAFPHFSNGFSSLFSAATGCVK